MPETKPTNPKDAIGVSKLPFHLIPASGKVALALAMLEGALKYGKYNWRVAGVRMSIYLDAAERHLESVKDGEDVDPMTLLKHLGNLMACAAIILDAASLGKLVDDRPPRGGGGNLIRGAVADVARLKELFKGHSPHQYTEIEDGAHARGQSEAAGQGSAEPVPRVSPLARAKRNGKAVPRLQRGHKRKAVRR
jgi:hypothetical protein